MIEKPLSRLCADLVVTCLAGLLLSPPVPAAEQIVIFGDGNTWRIRHHGVSSQSFLGTNTDASPCATVAAALEATRLTNHAEFGARFAGLTSEPRRQQAERLFNQWQSDARGYSHLIIDEAVASADGANAANPNAAAVSLAPFVPDAQGRKLLIVPGSRPTAVLLTNADNAWKINVGAQGEPVLNYLTKEALREVAPEAFAEETVRQAAGQREAYKLLARQLSLYEKGVHPATLGIAAKERYQLASKGVVITNWAAWKDYYNCQEFNPPVVYDMRDAWTPDFSTPLSAQRSYRHALHAADGKTLHDHMDASARDAFAFTYGTNWVSRTTFLLLPNIIKSIVLFTATTRFQGQDYVLVFFRAQEGTSPTSGCVTFQSDIFKRTPQGYVKTADLDYSSFFGKPEQAARLAPMIMPRYPKFLEQAGKSEFPKHYYTIDK